MERLVTLLMIPTWLGILIGIAVWVLGMWLYSLTRDKTKKHTRHRDWDEW